MRIALIAPPFIAVPPKKYGGTELFIAELAEGLQRRGHQVVVYANGESTVRVPTRWMYEKEQWPITGEVEGSLKGLSHASWAIKEASRDADVIHINNAPGLSFTRFVKGPFVYTIHHTFDKNLADYYSRLRDVHYVTISDFQRTKLTMPKMRTIRHGLNLNQYSFRARKQPYLCFLGRIAPPKGTHLAIQIAKESGIPLRIAGEVQPMYKDYWESMIKPQVDGNFVQYLGEMGMEEKTELLANSFAMLFPIQWDEPFGLVMIEAMACGTPVLALPGGSVAEVVKEGVSGHVRRTASELAQCARDLKLDSTQVRKYAEHNFSVERMVDDYIALYSEAAENERSAKVARIIA